MEIVYELKLAVTLVQNDREPGDKAYGLRSVDDVAEKLKGLLDADDLHIDGYQTFENWRTR